MSDQTKWTYAKIADYLESHSFLFEVDEDGTEYRVVDWAVGAWLAGTIRDDMQAEIDRLRRQNETLQHQLAELAKLAITPGEWEPVKDGATIGENIINVDFYPEQKGSAIRVNFSVGAIDLELPANMRLCQRVEVESTKASDK